MNRPRRVSFAVLLSLALSAEVSFAQGHRSLKKIDGALTDSIAAGVKSLRCHTQYLAGLGPKAPDPDEFLREAAQRNAARFGGRLAATFEVYR